jgi:hypothetical protein
MRQEKMKAAISIPTEFMDVLKCIEHNEDLKKFGENFKKCPGKFPKWIPWERQLRFHFQVKFWSHWDPGDHLR